MPQTFDEVIADVFTVKNDTIPSTAWPKLTCGMANEVTFQDSSLKLGDQREVYFQNAGQLRANADIRFLTGAPTATEKLRILANGNVGIGTTDPENSEGWNRVLDLLGTGTAKLSVRTNAIDARVMAHESGWWGAPAGMVMGTKGNHPLSFATNAASRLTILGDGRVGIGTPQPSARLSIAAPNAPELAGSVRSATLLTSAGSLGTVLGNELALATIGFLSANNSSLGIRALRVANGSDWFSTAIGIGMDVDNTVRAGASLWLHANGSIGIGTSNPQAKLHIAGVSPVLRIADGNEAAGKVLVSDASGNATWRDNSIFTISGNLNITSGTATNNFQKLTNIMTFNKVAAASTIEIRMNTRAGAGTFSGGTRGIQFQVRVDDAPSALANDGAITTSNAIEFLSVYAVFQSLAVGTHTVSVWIIAAGGTSSSVVLDPGGWGGRIIVKEVF